MTWESSFFLKESLNYSLPPSVVQAETVDTFKNRLDKYWSKQEVLYNYKESLPGVDIEVMLHK